MKEQIAVKDAEIQQAKSKQSQLQQEMVETSTKLNEKISSLQNEIKQNQQNFLTSIENAALQFQQAKSNLEAQLVKAQNEKTEEVKKLREEMEEDRKAKDAVI